MRQGHEGCEWRAVSVGNKSKKKINFRRETGIFSADVMQVNYLVIEEATYHNLWQLMDEYIGKMQPMQSAWRLPHGYLRYQNNKSFL